MAEVTVSKAARMAGKGRSTIQRHIKEGKLSCSKDEAGNPLIDVSELIRVYGTVKTDEADKAEGIRQHETPEPDQSAQAVIEALRDQLRAAQEREEWLRNKLDEERQHSRELEKRMLPPGEGEAPKKAGFFARLFSR